MFYILQSKLRFSISTPYFSKNNLINVVSTLFELLILRNMKKILLSGLMLFMMVSVFAQKNTDVDRSSAEAITQVFVEKYNLTDAQTVKMLKIQQRKLKNESEIAPLEATDIEKYLAKMSGNEQQTNFSIRRILDRDQAKILTKEEHELRTKRANVSSRMQKEGAAPLDIKKALIKVN
jgi:uncharacterized membrane protein YcgQ (UPF0703/DUF1980 family)